MTIKEMEEKVELAKKIRNNIASLKQFVLILSGYKTVPVKIWMEKGMNRHQDVLDGDNVILADIRQIFEEQIKDRENALKELDGEPEEKFFEILVPKGVYSVYRIKAKDTTDAFEKMAKMEEKDRVDSYVCERGFTLADSDFDYYYTANEEKQ